VRAVERPFKDGITRDVIALAWPIAAAMLAETLLGLVDTKLVGALGPTAIGGVSVGVTLMFFNYATIFGAMRAVKVRTAFAVGEGRPADGVRYATTGVVFGLAWGLVVWALGRDVSPALRFVRTDEALIPYARDFFAALTWGAPATCILASLINHRQALGDARTSTAVGIAGNVLNGFLSYALIHGRFGLPRLGVRGSGYGTAISEWVEVVVMLAILAREARGARPSIPYRAAARELVAIGLPTGLHFLGENLAFTTFGAILGNVGGADIAAHQIALVSIRTSFLPGIAMGEASCVLVGRALGRRRVDEALRAHRAALVMAIAFMAACGVVFALFGESIARAFTGDAGVIAIARKLLLVAAVFQVLDACNVVYRGSLRGAADVRVTAAIGIATVWICVPTAAFFLGKVAGWGALGAWIGFLGETTFGAAFFGWRWAHGAWRKRHGLAEPDKGEAPVALEWEAAPPSVP
jgi:MATE family multidrug resistance protein